MSSGSPKYGHINAEGFSEKLKQWLQSCDASGLSDAVLRRMQAIDFIASETSRLMGSADLFVSQNISVNSFMDDTGITMSAIEKTIKNLNQPTQSNDSVNHEPKYGMRYVVTSTGADKTLQEGDHIIFKSDGSIICVEISGWINHNDVKEAMIGIEYRLDTEIDKTRQTLNVYESTLDLYQEPEDGLDSSTSMSP